MRILYFSRDYTPHDHRFLSSLAETEHQVYFLALEKRGHRQEDRMLPKGITRVQWVGGERPARLRNGPVLLLGLRKVIRKIKPDLIHAGPIQTAGLLSALSGFQPLVTMSWGYDMLLDAGKNNRYRWATKKTFRNTQVFVCDCQAVKEKAIQHGMPEDRIVIFPWGIDLEKFKPTEQPSEIRARAGWQDNFVLLHNRSWAPIYGVDIIAKAFVNAARQNPKLRLLMPGNGSLAPEIRRIFLQGGAQDFVQFSGQVSQEKLPAYYQAADLYLSASHTDGSSVSLMESLASGLPALVSDIPGNKEWITPGEEGWLFPDGNIQSLTEKILAAASEPKQLDSMKIKARQLAEQRADWPANFEKLLSAYQIAVTA